MILYTYGTLRPGVNPTVLIPGSLFDLGWFPGAKLGGSGFIVCEPKEIDDFTETDRYEGFNPSDPDRSFFVRREVLDGYIYEYNGDVLSNKRVLSGDWLDYTSKERGLNAHRF